MLPGLHTCVGLSENVRFLTRIILLLGFLVTVSTQISCGPPPRGTIGAILSRKDSSRVFIYEVPPHLAAYRAGVRPGDELLFVEGQDVRRLNDQDLQRLLSGDVGEPVQLTLARGEDILRITIKRSMAEAYRLP